MLCAVGLVVSMTGRRATPAVADRREIDGIKHKLALQRQAQAELAAEGWESPPSRGSLKTQLALGVPEPSFVVDQLLPESANLLISAQYKKGKTTCALNLVRSAADGDDLFGDFTVKRPKGRIAWWNVELAERTALQWLGEMKVRSPLRVYPLHLRGYSVPLTLPAGRDWAVEWLRRNKIAWWVVDPFGALFEGDENDNSQVRDWLRALDEVKRLAGVDVLALITHTGHDAQDDDAVIRARGASRLMDWPDVIWTYRAGNEHDKSRRYLGAYGRDVDVPEVVLDFEPTTRTLTRALGVGSRRDDRIEALAYKAAEVVAEHHSTKKTPINATRLHEKLGSAKAADKRAGVEQAADMGWIRIDDGERRAKLHFPGPTPFRVTPRGRAD